jgi:hypothetical protein
MALASWLSRFWKGEGRERKLASQTLIIERDEDAELADLAALIEGGDTSPEGLERIAKLLAQSDPNADKL